MKLQIIFLQNFSQHTLIIFTEIKNTQIAETISHIHNNLMCLGFIQNKFIPLLTKLLNQFYKGVCSKRIVLGGHTKSLLCRFVMDIL